MDWQILLKRNKKRTLPFDLLICFLRGLKFQTSACSGTVCDMKKRLHGSCTECTLGKDSCIFVVPRTACTARGEEPAVPFCRFALDSTFMVAW